MIKELTAIEEVIEKTESGTQLEVAKAVGVSPQAVQKWVAQGFAPFSRCEQLESIYGVSALRLMSKKHRDTFKRLSESHT